MGPVTFVLYKPSNTYVRVLLFETDGRYFSFCFTMNYNKISVEFCGLLKCNPSLLKLFLFDFRKGKGSRQGQSGTKGWLSILLHYFIVSLCC